MRGPWAERAAVAVLMLALAALLAYGLGTDGVTNDEVIYVGAGWRQIALGDYRLNTTHPPLASSVAALGLLGLRPHVPPFTSGDDVLAYCYRFLHVDNDARAVLARARVPIVLLTLLLAVLCWAWSRQVAGRLAGLIALALVAFHPSLLAHGHLATTDLPSTVGMLAASFFFHRWTREPRPLWAVAAAVVLGLAVATRLTALVLLPCFAVLAITRAVRLRGEERARAWRHTAALVGIGALVLPLTIWAAYGFHDPPMEASVARPAGAVGLMLGATERFHVVPAAFLESVRFQIDHNRRGHLAYLLGQRSRHGWPYYFLVALLVKSTPGWLAALALSAAAGWRRRHPRPPAFHWLLPALATFVAVSAGNIQIGERYLLPVHAYLIVWAAVRLAGWVHEGRSAVRVTAVAVALAAHAAAALAVLPHGHLAYFNFLAGGPSGGHRVLLDSNLDWGQDLPRLAGWMREHGVSSVQLAYMGADDPQRLGIVREDLPGQVLYPVHPAAHPLTGTVVVSPNLLYGLVPSLAATYAPLRDRAPDGRAGVFFVYRLPEAAGTH